MKSPPSPRGQLRRRVNTGAFIATLDLFFLLGVLALVSAILFPVGNAFCNRGVSGAAWFFAVFIVFPWLLLIVTANVYRHLTWGIQRFVDTRFGSISLLLCLGNIPPALWVLFRLVASVIFTT